jgi:hypothetical protein
MISRFVTSRSSPGSTIGDPLTLVRCPEGTVPMLLPAPLHDALDPAIHAIDIERRIESVVRVG